MKIFVIDCETTGLDPAHDRVVELAAVEVRQASDLKRWVAGHGAQSFVNPHIPVPPESSGIHHIIDADVVGAPDLGEALDHVLTPMWRESVDIVAAHQARFDHGFLPPLKEKRWLCTWRCSLHVWPDAPTHSNAGLFYWLGFPRLTSVEHHRALFDATLTAHILRRLLEERSVDELLKLSRKAVVLKKVSFGMHFGKLWTEVPGSYLEWARNIDDFDPDVKFTIKTEIARRAALQS